MTDSIGTAAARKRAAATNDQGEPCPGCRRPLPIRRERPGETAAQWECTACYSPLTGVLLQDTAKDLASSIRLSPSEFDSTGVPPLPANLRQLVKEFVDSRCKMPRDQRRTTRMPRALDVTILELDERWMPVSKPLLGIVIDLTSHGLGLVSTRAVEAKYIAVQIRLPAGLVQIMGEVVWNKSIGHGFVNVGAQFLLRFGRSATRPEPAIASSNS